MMRLALALAASAATALLGGCAVLNGAVGEPRTLTVVNETGSPITAVHVREAGGRGIGANRLRGMAMRPGDRAEFRVRTRACRIDMTIRVQGQTEALFEPGFDICAGQPFVTPRFMSFETYGAALQERGPYEAAVQSETERAALRTRSRADEAARAAAAREAARGLPVCPGDPRCKKK